MQILSKLSRSALLWSYATTFLRFGGLIFVLPVVLRTVPNEELGLFYFFQTLSVLVTLIDAGIGPTVYRSVNYALVGAKDLKREGYDVAPRNAEGSANLSLLEDLIGTYSRFYHSGALGLLIVLLLVCSPFVWKITSELQHPLTGRSIWIFLALGGALNFAGALWNSMLMGLNRVREQQKVQLLSIGCGYLVTVVGLLMGIGLWALALSSVVQAFLARWLSRRLSISFLRDIGVDLTRSRFNGELFATLWPSAWRSGLVSAGVSAYLSIPVFFTTSFSSLDKAGSVGLGMQLSMTVGQVAAALFIVKGPMFGILRVSGEIEKLRRLFFIRLGLMCLILIAGGSAVVLLGDWAIHGVIHSKTPLPGTPVLVLILLFASLDGIQSTFRGLAISANQLSFWKVFILGGIVVALVSFFTLQAGITAFLATLVATKFVIIDLPIIHFGLKTLKQ